MDTEVTQAACMARLDGHGVDVVLCGQTVGVKTYISAQGTRATHCTRDGHEPKVRARYPEWPHGDAWVELPGGAPPPATPETDGLTLASRQLLASIEEDAAFWSDQVAESGDNTYGMTAATARRDLLRQLTKELPGKLRDIERDARSDLAFEVFPDLPEILAEHAERETGWVAGRA